MTMIPIPPVKQDGTQTVVMLCGPFRASTRMQMLGHVRRAIDYSSILWAQGYAVIVPHTNTNALYGHIPEPLFLSGYRTIVSRCDALAVMPGWEQSEGSKGEIAEAERLNKPVFYLDVLE